MRIKALLLMLCLPAFLSAEESKLDKLVQRQAAFGRTIPQEKVFIHMDNTSYQLGDTIWFSAYLRRTDKDKPSNLSGVLYVELYGHEGYMIERKLIQMKEGHGSGFFALTKDVQYAGFYELRAYTRWQLNWGLFEHKHTLEMSKFFSSKRQEKEFYRDYEKLYSRVFPVYDKPLEPGEYTRDMTLRAMRRIYKEDPEKSELKLSLFPEGGNLVEGLPCRVAFEAAFGDGECADGFLVYDGDTVKTVNRGRGCFELVPQKGLEKDVVFVNKDGKTAKAKLPKPEQTGVSLRLEQRAGGTEQENTIIGARLHPSSVFLHPSSDLPLDSLALSLMHDGRFVDWRKFTELEKEGSGLLYSIADSLLVSSGIYQLTVFDTKGRVFADRLFFSRGKESLEPTLSIEGLKEEYQPYEQVKLNIKEQGARGKEQEASLSFSLSVRDDFNRDFLYDDGNILTEMLLSSEIRGFVPQPGWYFEQDDEEHRQALDLLMMTQGWRRFNWRSMAVQGAWDVRQPAERAPILIGRTYENVSPYDDETIADQDKKKDEDDLDDYYEKNGYDPPDREQYSVDYDLPQTGDWGTRSTEVEQDKAGYRRSIEKQAEKRTELKVHGEQVMLDYDKPVECECVTNRGQFRIQLLPFFGQSVLFLSVADTTKWKEGEHYTWIQAESDNEYTDFMYLPKSAKARRKIFVEPADYLARVDWPYPHFVKPYTYYQKNIAPPPAQPSQSDGTKVSQRSDLEGVTTMREVTVKAKRKNLLKFDDTWPILIIDALEADNMCMDYGLDFMRIMVGDYGVGTKDRELGKGQEPTYQTRYGVGYTRRMLMDKDVPPDSLYARKYLSSFSIDQDGTFRLTPYEELEYSGTGVWDKYVLYSDYSPRMEGSNLYYGSGEPKTKLVQYPFSDGSRRITYRDRRYILNGFAYPAEFYSPDYSKQVPSEEKKDYRRTLYWNPNVKLDENGEAEVKFYNNSRTTQLSVEAEGQSSDGTLLWTK